MKILSIDVGIKNLAFCLLSSPSGSDQFQIEKWDTVNLSQPTEEVKCGEMDKTKICGKLAKFMKNEKCFCLKHSKKQPFLIPSPDVKPSFINKQKLKNLQEIATKHKIPYDINNIKKAELVTLINNYILEKCFEPIEKPNASKVDLVTIGRNIQKKLDSIFSEDMMTISNVIIENQISPIANRMKTIQGMIAQYFIMRNNDIRIEFVSSVNKLKDVGVGVGVVGVTDVATDVVSGGVADAKKKYKDRKLLGIQRCLHLVNNNDNYKEWCSFFTAHTKKDDLADALLQGIWFVNKNKN